MTRTLMLVLLTQVGEPIVETPADEVYQIGMQMRCPVCQGMPIAESPATMAQDMMKKVRVLHAEGKGRQEIFDYFVARYGEWVLLSPRPAGFNMVVWLLPGIVALAAALAVGLYVRGRKRARSIPAATVPNPTPASSSGDIPDDEYLGAVREEMWR